MNSSPLAPSPKPIKPVWYSWVTISALIMMATIVIITIAAIGLDLMQKAGVSGTEFIALLLIPIALTGAGAAVVCGIVSVGCLLQERPRGKRLTTIIASCIVSVAYISYVIFQIRSIGVEKQRLQTQDDATIVQTQAAYAPKSISLEDATDLIQRCQIAQFYYGDEAVKIGENADKSTTGVYIVYANGRPWRISAGSRTEDQLLPIAQAAATTCGVPLINRDS